jgi:hypothetical protein
MDCTLAEEPICANIIGDRAMRPTLIACTLALMSGATVADDSESLPPTKLHLTPQAAPVPALRYQLLTELRDQRPGNAAEHYKKAYQLLEKNRAQDWQQVVDEWLKMPLQELPRKDVAAFLKPHAEAFRELDAAARCEGCDWELTDQLRKTGGVARLDEIAHIRDLGTFLIVRARLELADGELDKALRSTQTGFAMARHAAQCPALIASLVSVSLAERMTRTLEETLQNPKAPNLYWALTDLPRPFVDLRRGLQGERLMTYGNFPGLAEAAADPDAGAMAPEQIKECVDRLLERDRFDVNSSLFPDRNALGKAVRDKYELGKKALIEKGGRPREKVEAMPHVQVALLHAMSEYDRVFDELVKWQNLSYAEAAPGLHASREEAVQMKHKALLHTADAPALSLAALLLPACEKAYKARARVDRHLAALRCVEAIRLYTAAHEGKLPGQLEDIKEVPVPIDPSRGKVFRYELDGNKATLTCEPIPHDKLETSMAPAYELILKP